MPIKTVQEIYLEAQALDLPFIESISTEVQALIDAENTDATDFEIVYDASTDLQGLGTLQQQRILRELALRFRTSGYRTSVSYTDFTLTISWSYLGL